MSGVRPVAWLDRDGTILDDPGYLSDPEGVVLLAGAAAAIARLNRAGVLVAMVTNQSGIGRGLFTPTQLDAVHARLASLLAEHGAQIDAIDVCPHRPTNSSSKSETPCGCRKPEPGMIDRTRAKLGIDPQAPQYVVGDKAADLGLARNAGCRALLVLTGEGRRTQARLQAAGTLQTATDWIAANLGEAVDRILEDLGLAPQAPNC